MRKSKMIDFIPVEIDGLSAEPTLWPKVAHTRGDE